MKMRTLSAGMFVALGGAAVAGCPNPVPVPPTPGPVATQCVAPQAKPLPVLPWKNVDELCNAPHGKPWSGPPWDQGEEKAALAVQSFLRSEQYKMEPYLWIHDADWRLTGAFEGCPCPDPADVTCKNASKGTHPGVRIYYSPEVIDWMCKYRRDSDSDQLPNAGELPDNAMIIKEMISLNSTKLALVPGTNELWIAPLPGKHERHYDKAFDSWTIMLKNRSLSADGWFWGYYDKTSKSNPPLWDRSAFTKTPFPGQDGAKVNHPPGCDWQPTSGHDQPYPNAEAGNYCVYCHASAQGEATFASFDNIMGTEIQYPWTPSVSTRNDSEDHARRAEKSAPSTAVGPAIPSSTQCSTNPFPQPRREPLPGFRKAFPELDPPYSEVWDTRLPSHTWDHAPSMLGVTGVAPSSSQFLTSDQCESCHEAGGSGQLALPYMVEKVNGEQIDVSPWAEWSVSPMGLAGRDPVFHSQLELERNIARDQPGLAGIKDCIDNTCLHCHGGAGARQYNIDTAGKGPAGDPCKDFLPPKEQRLAADYDGALFTARMVTAWRDESPELARYGGLARDGINCAMCHHLADKDLDQLNLPKTFTGNFRVGPPDKIYGPFPNEASKEAIKPKPMQYTLGITPEAGKQLVSSEMCGTCHTIKLPVFNDAGGLHGKAYEQTTFLEWLLSDFSGYGADPKGGKSCQDCHMPHEYRGKAIHTGIANVLDTRYPKADFLLPATDVDIAVRPYKRHQLHGLNVFLNAYAQQYPLLLGIRQQNFMNGNVRAPLFTGLESALEVADKFTAELQLTALAWKGDALEAQVTVQNLTGHSLPSGVSFRRLFVQVEVLDSNDKALWASGRTNEIGMILRGTTDEPLPTESFQRGPDGLPFQPHRQIVTAEDQVLIYEELTQNASQQFTTSFLHRYWAIKDNRIRPRGYSPERAPEASLRDEYADATRPGSGPERNGWPRPPAKKYQNASYPAIEGYTDTKNDPDYQLSAHPKSRLPGTDTVTYRMTLHPSAKSAARRVRVTLYSQSTPPYFLKERFVEAAEQGAERAAATRMYYMAGHLDTSVKWDGRAYLAGYRLQVGAAAVRDIPSASSH